MRDGSATKELIRRTALALFVEKGVTETTIRDIAAGAGVAEGTMYRHFASKDDLAWDLYITNLLVVGADFDRAKAENRHIEDQNAAMIRMFCALFEKDPLLFSYLLLVRHTHQKKVSKDQRTPLGVVHETIAEAIKCGDIPDQDPMVLAAMVFGMVQQVAASIVAGRLSGSLSDHAEVLTAASWRVLKG